MEKIEGMEADAFVELAHRQSEIFEKLLCEVSCARNYFKNLLQVARESEHKNEDAEEFARKIHDRLSEVIKEAEDYTYENNKACEYLQRKYGPNPT